MLQKAPTSSCNKPTQILGRGGELDELETKLSSGCVVFRNARVAWTNTVTDCQRCLQYLFFSDKACVDSMNINKPGQVKAKSGRKVNYSCTLAIIPKPVAVSWEDLPTFQNNTSELNLYNAEFTV